MAPDSKELNTYSNAELLLLSIDDALRVNNAEVRNIPWERGGKVMIPDGTPRLCSRQFRYCFLRAVADLLDLAPEQWPVRHFIRELLNGISLSVHGKLRLEKVMERLHDPKWTKILILDCGDIAHVLRWLVRHLENIDLFPHKDDEEIERKAENQLLRRKKLERRPVPFCHEGRKYTFGYLQSRLLKFLGDCRKYSAIKVIKRLWKKDFDDNVDLAVLENRLHNLQHRTNQVLKAKNLPYEITRPELNYLQLVHLR